MFPSPFARLFGMVSTSFVTANHTANGRGKLSKNRTVIRKLSFALRPRCPIFVYGDAIFALPESLFIDYSGAKYVRSALKIAATQKSLF